VAGDVALGVDDPRRDDRRRDRKTATEYSFFAAVPIMVAATGYTMLKSCRA